MFTLILCACIAPGVLSIIVKDPPPSGNEYHFSYDIQDPATGDTKSQQEVRKGDIVSGSYTVLDPDGTKRTVEYTADPKNGFTAVIHKESTKVINEETPIEQKSHKYVKESKEFSDNEYGGAVPYIPLNPVYSSDYSDLYSSKYSHSPYYSKSGPGSSYDYYPSYFTPGNDIRSDSDSFDHGHYFKPADYH